MVNKGKGFLSLLQGVAAAAVRPFSTGDRSGLVSPLLLLLLLLRDDGWLG